MVTPQPNPITTTEMHTGGEPVRIVESGYPEIIGATILDKRRYARQHLDHLRKLLMFEPRGHSDMYGVIRSRSEDMPTTREAHRSSPSQTTHSPAGFWSGEARLPLVR